MPYFLAGLALLVLLIFAARLFAKANPRLLASVMRKLSGIIAIAAAGFLALRGALPLAIPLGLFGFSLIRPSAFGFGPFASSSKSPGGTSHVQTESLEMELDHDSGEMEGMVLKGGFEGRMLSSLSDAELTTLLDEIRDTDQQAEALMEAYLDWRLPGWREAENEKDKKEQSRARSRKPSGHMRVDEAYAVLGLKRGASEEEITRAHRLMMKKFHPDQGGSTYLASRINEAKDVLLGR
ncbi:MAG TPA: DnaJ domain-containing protein [Methyloceanibacter sp.]|jgi:DnaJ domain